MEVVLEGNLNGVRAESWSNMKRYLAIPWYGMYSYGRTVLYMASVPGGTMRRPLCSSYFVSFVEFLVFLKD